jgi:YaiO family outer membrane protein
MTAHPASAKDSPMRLLLPALLPLALLSVGAPAAAQSAPAAADGYVARLEQARALATSGDPAQREQALALYAAMLADSPGNSDVLLARGRTFAWMQRYAEAESDLRAVTGARPDYADAWSALGDMYLWSGRPRLAADAYAHWVALAPDDPAPRVARGRALRDAGDPEGARIDFAAAAERGAPAADVARLAAGADPRTALPEATVGDGYSWSLRAGVDRTTFTGGREAWTDADVALRRKFERGSLALEWLQADHFGSTDHAWALDGYVSLWARAYANLRYQRGPSDGILPRDAWRAELFQGVGRGWELSASVDHLRFNSDTEFYGVGVGRYVGNWYLRYKLQHVPGVSSGSWSHRVLARNYYRGDADDYVEVSASSGRSSDLDRTGALVRNSNAALGVAWVHYFHPRWGFKLGAGYADDADGFDERRLSFALYTRW